ncbi:MAG TPA: phosphoribosylamine--glycine ligase [Fibrobacteraceae bacterium]|jgi:phosphoribosylamine--glycine ligase|nr:phosphoribosylamine--glycine ligase [Fibrobacteraceae bacterium]
MNILVIGSGGREHAIAYAVKQSPLCQKLVCAPGNPGMSSLGECIPVSVSDPKAIADLAEKEKIDLTIIGPEIPLVAGVVDEFRKRGLRAFGPIAAAAALEGSKAFSKNVMKKYGIPTADYETFTDLESAQAYLRAHPAPIVVKASGLAAGKGAVVCLTDEEAFQAIEEMLGEKAVFGESGKTVVIEEFMEGEEASLFAICDGKDYVLLSSAQDHKRIFDNDLGPNTGGMGAYSPAPVVTESLLEDVKKRIIEPTLAGMIQEGAPYTGVLYVGIMVTKNGPKVVEYNCRLGDPECQIVLPLYDGDVLALFDAAERGALSTLGAPKPPKGSAAIVVLASEGYPNAYEAGQEVSGIEEAEKNGARVLHAGTKMQNEKLVTAGGRVFGVVGSGKDLSEALRQAYEACEKVNFKNKYYRRDIGKKGLERCSK